MVFMRGIIIVPRNTERITKMADNDQNGTASTAPYVPWATFTNTLDALAGNIPNRIDRTVFPGQSGGTQNQLLTAFRFFGFISDDGKPQPVLAAIAVPDADQRKVALRRLIEAKYADLFALNLTKTTPSELAEQMTKSYNVTGDTRLKATRFFLNAAQHVGVAVSPLLMRDRSTSPTTSAPRRRRGRQRQGGNGDDSTPRPSTPPPAQPTVGTSRSIELKSGGTLTLSASLDLFSLNPADRAYVFGLIDKLDEYEKQNATE